MRESKYFVKKSFNLAKELEAEIEAYIKKNPGINFTLLMNQALRAWLKNPTLDLQGPVKECKIQDDKYKKEFPEFNG